MGCGITAHSKEDAVEMLETLVFPFYGTMQIQEIVEDVDISSLDKGVVRPNMKSPLTIGIWFPLLP